MDPDNLPTCTSAARQVVNELYRHMLERATVAGSNTWVMDVDSMVKAPRARARCCTGMSREGFTLVRSVALSAAPVRLRRSEHPRDGAATLVTAGRLSPV